MSFLIVILFFGGWLFPFVYSNFLNEILLIFKVLCMLYLFVLVRGALPRYRYDQLMQLGWVVFLPISLAYLIFLIIFLYFIYI
jgi:NADH-quinone oxidoreductase subunit H